MSTVTLPTDLTKEKLIEMEPAELIKLTSTPEGKALVEQVWNAQPEAAGGAVAVAEPEPTAEEIAAQAEADRQAAEVQRLADEAKAAEDARKLAEAEAERKKQQAPTKFVFDREIKDAKGNVVRRIHLEASTQEELNQKIADSYGRLTEAYENLKVQKLTVKKEVPAEPALSDDELEALVKEIRKGDDPKSAVAALKKVTGIDKSEAEKQRLAVQQAEVDAQRTSNEFMRRHIHDFNPCEANGKVIGEYILGKNPQGEVLDWTLDNLELALLAVQDKLAPVVTPNPVAAVVPTPAPVVPANPEPTPAPVAPAAPALEAPAVPVVTVPVPVAPVVPAPAANPAPARRPPSSGVVPGSTQGGTPTATAPDKYTKLELVKMDRKLFRQKLEKETGFRELVVKLFNAKS